MAGASKRVAKDLDAIRRLKLKCFRDIQAVANNILLWKGLLMPDNPPYNKGAFWIEICFPCEYPYKPPTIMFKTKIYHPNVNEENQFCLPIINEENWSFDTGIEQVIYGLIELVDNPDIDHSLNSDMAKVFKEEHERFLLQAEDHTCKFSEKRPCE